MTVTLGCLQQQAGQGLKRLGPVEELGVDCPILIPTLAQVFRRQGLCLHALTCTAAAARNSSLGTCATPRPGHC